MDYTKIYSDMVSALDDDTALIIVCQVLSQRVGLVPAIMQDVDRNHRGAAGSMLAGFHAAASQAASLQAASAGNSDGRFYGYIKSFQLEKGYGFVSCPELKATYGKDAFLHHHQLGIFSVGSEVSFLVRHNKSGDPQAHDLEDCSGLAAAQAAAQSAAQAAQREAEQAAAQAAAQAAEVQAAAEAQAAALEHAAALEATLERTMRGVKRTRQEERVSGFDVRPPAGAAPAAAAPPNGRRPRVPDLMALTAHVRGEQPPDTPATSDAAATEYDPFAGQERADELRSASQHAKSASHQLMMEMAFQAATPEEQVASFLREQAMAGDSSTRSAPAAIYSDLAAAEEAPAPKEARSAALDAAAMQALRDAELQEHALAIAAEQQAAQTLQGLGLDINAQGFSNDEALLAQALAAAQSQQQGGSRTMTSETLARAQAFAHMTFDRHGLAIPAGRKGVPCKFFGEGRCQKGDLCDFSHDPEMFMEKSLAQKSPTPCTFFGEGRCSRGAACPFAHGMEELMAIQAAKGAARGRGGRFT